MKKLFFLMSFVVSIAILTYASGEGDETPDPDSIRFCEQGGGGTCHTRAEGDGWDCVDAAGQYPCSGSFDI